MHFLIAYKGEKESNQRKTLQGLSMGASYEKSGCFSDEKCVLTFLHYVMLHWFRKDSNIYNLH